MSKAETSLPLNLDVEFQNLGKINQATIKLRPFTVIAGCNGSGKSFITKSLYSVFSVMPNTDSDAIFESLAHSIYGNIRWIYDHTEKNELLNELFSHATYLKGLFTRHEFSSVLEVQQPRLEKINEVNLTLDKLNLSEIKSKPKEQAIFDLLFEFEIENKTEEIRIDLEKLSDFVINPVQLLNHEASEFLYSSFTDNFMIPSLDYLTNFTSESNTSIQLGKTKPIEIIHEDFFISHSVSSLISSINSHPPVYLESPIYWKLIDALEESKKILNYKAQKRRLEKNQLVSQVPKYFFDLMELLEVQVKTDGFSDIVRSIEEAINGSLSFSDGNIQFSDKASNSSVGLNLTALGVANLGMIALLLKRGAILPGTFLFIDEPEVHLHPAWQVVLIQVLHELSKRGVNVVIASHSIDIMKAIENIMDSDDSIDPQTHFGINQLTKNGNSVNDSENNYKRLAAIKEDLGRPFYEMFMDGLEP